MVKIIQGTTPTIQYDFHVVSVSDISVAVLTFKQGGNIVIEKSLQDAIVGADSLSWKLTQEESLGLAVGKGNVMCNWLLLDGTRGASEDETLLVLSNHKREVI